jgi:hypothetical protein
MQSLFNRVYKKAPRAESGILFRRAALQRVNRDHALETVARQRAKAIVRDAEKQAEIQHAQARLDGYRDGIALFLDLLIAETDRVAQTYADEIASERQEVIHRVEALLKDTETARALAEEYLQADNVKARGDRQVTVYVPHWCKLRAEVVDQLSVDAAHRVVLTGSPTDRFVISDGQFAISFSPFDASAQICTRPHRTDRAITPDITSQFLTALLSRIQNSKQTES